MQNFNRFLTEVKIYSETFKNIFTGVFTYFWMLIFFPVPDFAPKCDGVKMESLRCLEHDAWKKCSKKETSSYDVAKAQASEC